MAEMQKSTDEAVKQRNDMGKRIYLALSFGIKPEQKPDAQTVLAAMLYELGKKNVTTDPKSSIHVVKEGDKPSSFLGRLTKQNLVVSFRGDDAVVQLPVTNGSIAMGKNEKLKKQIEALADALHLDHERENGGYDRVILKGFKPMVENDLKAFMEAHSHHMAHKDKPYTVEHREIKDKGDNMRSAAVSAFMQGLKNKDALLSESPAANRGGHGHRRLAERIDRQHQGGRQIG